MAIQVETDMILVIDVGNTHTVVGVYQYSEQDSEQNPAQNPTQNHSE